MQPAFVVAKAWTQIDPFLSAITLNCALNLSMFECVAELEGKIIKVSALVEPSERKLL